MKPGDFVDVHTSEGCYIGRLVSDDGDFLTVEIGTCTVYGIPKDFVTLWLSV